jgi:hypothetical protein
MTAPRVRQMPKVDGARRCAGGAPRTPRIANYKTARLDPVRHVITSET